MALLPRDGGAPRWASDEAFWLWHTVNAYDDGPGEDAPVVLDYVQWSRPTVGDAPGTAAEPVSGGLVRARIDPAAGSMLRSGLDDRLIGRRHRHVAPATETGRTDLLAGEYDAVRWYDTATGSSRVWDAGDLSVGEPVFAPEPGRDSEDPAAGPVARARIPVRVPLGLHGSWLPTEGVNPSVTHRQ